MSCFKKGHIVTGVYYSELLKCYQEAIKENKPGMLTRGGLFRQGNAPPRTSVIAMAIICNFGYEHIPHPTYSPDLAPSDLHLFPQMKKAV